MLTMCGLEPVVHNIGALLLTTDDPLDGEGYTFVSLSCSTMVASLCNRGYK